MQRILFTTALLASLGAVTSAAEVRPKAVAIQPRADLRFASSTAEVPNFQRHVLPLMGRLGCNGRGLSWFVPGPRRVPVVAIRLRLQIRSQFTRHRESARRHVAERR